MNFHFTYEIDYQRVIPAIEIDARDQNPAIANQVGSVIQAYTNSVVAQVTSNVIPYRIETDNGVLAGYFTLIIQSGAASIQLFTLRPAFRQFSAQISQLLSSFIASNGWQVDYIT